jgi:multidrug resistance efflux pump
LPVKRVEIRAQVDGILAEIAVDEGDRVEAQQLLARLDDRDIRASIEQARSEVVRRSANLEKMTRGSRPEEIAKAKTAVAAAADDLKFAKIEADRRERLHAQGVGSAELRDNARRDLALRRAELAQAQAAVQLLEAGFRDEEIRMAEAELAGATADLQHLTTMQDRFVIRSPIAGQILTPRFKERLHSRLSAGETICEVADTSSVRVEILVPEQEIDLIEIGQSAVVKVQSHPLRPFTGGVEFIAPTVEQEGNKRHIRVVTVIDNSEGLLQEGMTGYGEIDTGRSTLLRLALRRVVRWVRVRFLI